MTIRRISVIPYGAKKLLGAYPQRQEGLFMQRIPLLGGRIAPFQFRHIAQIARIYGRNTPLHITTRQDIELHNILGANLPSIQAGLAEIGISTYGAGGDSVRNILVSPDDVFDPQAVDLFPLAEQVAVAMPAAAMQLGLPRKFKISFSGGGDEDARPYVQDLGFVAESPTSIRVIGAGSLGPRPQTGMVLVESIAPEEVLPLVFAALDLFAEHGDRQNRRTARLRHIRQRLGDVPFKQLLDAAFNKHKASTPQFPIRLTYGAADFQKRFMLQTLGGKLTCEQAIALAEIADRDAMQLRINLWHGIDLYSREPFELPDILTPLTNRPRIVACPGSSTCTNGLTDCRAAAETMADVLSRTGQTHLTVGISGCANNCALSAICDIGLVGRLKTLDGVRQEAYDIYRGGGNGRDSRLAERNETLAASKLGQYFDQSPRRDGKE